MRWRAKVSTSFFVTICHSVISTAWSRSTSLRSVLVSRCAVSAKDLFAAIALGGSALLNIAAKQIFARDRPSLWESIAPEHNYSFPSGHAMGSVTLACVLVLLAWRTRWRWPVTVAMAAFVLLVGLSRIYLGVHYPSDILAGWAVATAWAVAVYLIAFRGGVGPWQEAGRRS